MSDSPSKWSPSDDTVPILTSRQDQFTQRRTFAIIITTLPILLHVVFVIVTACFVCLYLDGHNFGIDHRDRLKIPGIMQSIGLGPGIPFSKRWVPLQTDMITALSVLLGVTRFFLLAWCTDVAWKYMFILLEQTGLSVSQMRDLVNYKILFKSRLHKDNLPAGVHLHHVLATLILLLPFPAQFSSPVITGSITWKSSDEFLTGAPLGGVPVFSNGQSWTDFQTSEGWRADTIAFASRLHDRLYTSTDDTPLKRSLSIAFPRLLAPGSSIANIPMPFISLSNLTWITNVSQIPTDQLEAVDPVNGMLSVTSLITSVLFAGAMAIIPPQRWEPARNTSTGVELPPTAIFDQQLYIAFWPFKAIDGDCSQSPPDYEGLLLPKSADWYYTNGTCFIFATADVKAGTKKCKKCEVERSQAASVDELSFEDVPLEPDRLVHQVFALMPQTINVMEQFGVYLPTDGTLDDYVQGVLKRAYVMGWSALTDMNARDDTTLTGSITAAVPSTGATVSKLR